MRDLAHLEQHAAILPKLERALAACADVVAASAVLEISGSRPGWVDTGLDVVAGQRVSLLSFGVVWLAKPLDIGFEGRSALWYRIGNGPIAKLIDNTGTFTAVTSGRLEVINRWLGEWLDETGAFEPDHPHMPAEGGFSVGVIVWNGDAAEGLARLAKIDSSGLASIELERLGQERPEPRGWSPLWRLGRTPIYCDAVDDNAPPRITCRCSANAGILRYPIDIPLDESTRLSWRWLVTALPSEVAEDTLPTHDYLSIAVEFENGQDLSYLWSAALPVEHAFRCPLPWWDRHETHLVVRSSADEIGRWVDEERPVLADYRRAIASSAPRRVVAVWLIAVSAFQRGVGSCDYAGIMLSAADREVTIGP